MKTFDEYKALVEKKYRLIDEIDDNWCDNAYGVLSELGGTGQIKRASRCYSKEKPCKY